MMTERGLDVAAELDERELVAGAPAAATRMRIAVEPRQENGTPSRHRTAPPGLGPSPRRPDSARLAKPAPSVIQIAERPNLPPSVTG